MASPKKASLPQVEAYEVVEVHRSELLDAPYNPRILDEKSRKKLKAGIKKLGLLGPPIWNERTKNIVGGHQRVSILDSLKGTSDYTLKVAKVSLDERQEREANLLLNNPEAQGGWDLEKLESMFRDEKMDLEATGFDVADVYRLFGDSPLTEHGSEQIDELAAKLRERREAYENVVGKSKSRDTEDFYLVVVFKDADDRKALLDELEWDENRFQDGNDLRSKFYALRSQVGSS